MLLPAPMESRSPPMTVLVVGRHYPKLYTVNRGQCQNMFNNKYYGLLRLMFVLFFALHISISTTRLGKTSSDALWQKSVSHDMIGWLTHNKQKHDYICIAYFTLCNYDQALCTCSNNYKLLLVVVVVTFLQGPAIHTKKSLFFTFLHFCTGAIFFVHYRDGF